MHSQHSCLTETEDSKVHAFMIPVIIPSGSGPGGCNKEIILKENVKDNYLHNFLIYAVFTGAISVKFLKVVKVRY